MTLELSHPEVLDPPEHAPACCTQQTFTVAASVNLAAPARLASHRADHGEDLTDLLPPRLRDALIVAVELGTRPVSLEKGFALVVANWHASGDFSRQTQGRLGEMVAHAVARARYLGVTHFDDAFDEQACTKFIRSPVSSALTTPRRRARCTFAAWRCGRAFTRFVGWPTSGVTRPSTSSCRRARSSRPVWRPTTRWCSCG